MPIGHNNYFLIHGSMLGVPLFFKSKKTLEKEMNLGMFEIFEDELNKKYPNFYLFKWIRDTTKESKIKPLFPLKAYFKDKKAILSETLQNRLYLELKQQEPCVICAHSMGSELLLLTIDNFGIPDSVKIIYTINSDSNQKRNINNINIIEKINSGKLLWINLYSYSDLTLLSSCFLNNGAFRAGQVGYSYKLVKNIKIKIHGDHNYSLKSEVVKNILLTDPK